MSLRPQDAQVFTFRIQTLKSPKHYKDFAHDFFVIAQVWVTNLQCSLVFKGYLPSCAPYILWTFKRPHVIYKDELIMEHASSCTEGTYELISNVKTLQWMLQEEMVYSPVDDGHNKYVYDYGILSTCKTYQENLANMVDVMPVLKQCEFIFKHYCDYYRLPHMIELLKICFKYYPKNKQHKVKMLIREMTTEDMIRTLETKPLDLFLNAEKTFKVYLPTYGSFFDRASGAYKPWEMCAARIMDYFRRIYVEEQRNTGCTFQTLKEHFLQIEPGAKNYYDQAFWLLVRSKALIYRRGQDPMVTLPTLDKHARRICDFFRALSTVEAYPIKRTAGVPGIPPQLTDEQTRAAWHAFHNPLTIVVGPPGRGKTSMIVWAMAMWKNAACVSFVGTNVAAHRERMGGRPEVSNTAHHFFNTCGKHPEWPQLIEAFIWDEFSNVPDALAAKTLGCLGEATKRTLFVLDPAQIAPIKPGHVGMDLIAAFPDMVHTLSVNLRVSANSRALAEAAVHMLNNVHAERIEWSDDIKDKESITYIEARPNVPFREAMRRILQHVLVDEAGFYRVTSLRDLQFIAFTREMRDEANEVIEELLGSFPVYAGTRKTQPVPVRTGLTVYTGCKICIRGESFPAFSQGYHAIRNGEMGIVRSACRTAQGVEIRLDVGHRVKRILASKQLHVNPANIHLAHVITADVSQGSEYATVVGLFHDNCISDTWIGRSRVYVMASRAQQAFIAYGKNVLNAFNTLASRVESPRSSYLLPMLREISMTPRENLDDDTSMDMSGQVLCDFGEPCCPVPHGFKEI